MCENFVKKTVIRVEVFLFLFAWLIRLSLLLLVGDFRVRLALLFVGVVVILVFRFDLFRVEQRLLKVHHSRRLSLDRARVLRTLRS